MEEQSFLQIKKLAAKYSTPVYIYDFMKIQKQINKIKESLHPVIRLFYSVKANPNATLTKCIYDTGINLEICSPLEFNLVKEIGASPTRVMYLGPGKTIEEIENAIVYGINYLIAESIEEIHLINRIANKHNKQVDVGIRVNPSIAVKGAKLRMGGTSRQFGIDESQVSSVIEATKRLINIRLKGIHGYHGTRVLSTQILKGNFQYMLRLADSLIEKYDLTLKYVGIGGGLGVPYFEGEKELDIDTLGQTTHDMFEEFHKKYSNIEIILESGRYLVAESGIFITKILYTKVSQGKEYIITDAGTNHFASTIGANNVMMKSFPIIPLSKSSHEIRSYTITGPLCTPNDIHARNVSLPKMNSGGFIGIQKTGAYGLTSSPVLFLSHKLPREVLLFDNKDILIRERNEYITELRDVLNY